MMKRILFAVLAALLLFSLAACRKEGEENQVTSDPGENSMLESTSETEASSPDYDENGNFDFIFHAGASSDKIIFWILYFSF